MVGIISEDDFASIMRLSSLETPHAPLRCRCTMVHHGLSWQERSNVRNGGPRNAFAERSERSGCRDPPVGLLPNANPPEALRARAFYRSFSDPPRRDSRRRRMAESEAPRMRTLSFHSGAAFEAGELGHRNGEWTDSTVGSKRLGALG